MRKTLSILIILALLLNSSNSDGSSSSINSSWGYSASAKDYYKKAIELASVYPNLVKVEDLGETLNGNKLYAIVFTEGVDQLTPQSYIDKTNVCVDGGIHARETYSTYEVFKWLEERCLDYVNPNYSSAIDSKELLGKCIFHLIPLANPDGFDLTKFGINIVVDANVKSFLLKYSSASKLKNSLKANLNLVDINRNFTDSYFNKSTGKWDTMLGKETTSNVSSVASVAYYGGSKQASEVETRVLESYFLKYNFKLYITYHSQGEVIYYDQFYLYNKTYDAIALRYAKIAHKSTGYTLMPEKASDPTSSGYSSNFISNNTLRPCITLETTKSTTYPIPEKYYNTTHNKLIGAVDLMSLEASREVWGEYKLYANGLFVRDIWDKEYANALAGKYGYDLVTQTGKPSLLNVNYVKTALNSGMTLVGEKILIYEIDKPYMLLDGEVVQLDKSDFGVTPRKVEGVTLLPIRNLVESLGGEVEYKEGKFMATVGEEGVVYNTNDNSLFISDVLLSLHDSPVTVDGVMMFPLNLVLDCFDLQFLEEDNKLIFIKQ